MATASERAVRTESRDVSKKVHQLESEFRDFKTEMQVSNRTLMEMLTQIKARLARLEEAGSGSQMADGRGIHPPVTVVDADATLARNNSRYRNLETDRNAVIDRNAVVDRIECPVYDGSNAFKSWLHKCEQYLDINRIPANRMVRSVSFRLEGLALEWHQSFMEDKQDRSVSWDEYVRNMSLRFDSGRIKDPIVQNIEVSMTEDSSSALHEDTNVGNLGLLLLDRPLEMVDEFEEMDEGKFDSIIGSGKLESEMVQIKEDCRMDLDILDSANSFEEIGVKRDCMLKLDDVTQAILVKDQAVAITKEEAVVEFPAHGLNVGFEELKETMKSELFDLGNGAFVNLNQDVNKQTRVDCLDEMKTGEYGYQVLGSMVDHVWFCKALVLMLERGNFSSSVFDSYVAKGRTVGVAWDFKKRKKSLMQLVGVLVNNGKIQEQVCFLSEVQGTAVRKCKEEDIGISVAEVLNLKLMCHE